MTVRLTSLEDLLACVGPDPVLAHDVGATFAGAYAEGPGAAWVLARRHTRTWLTVRGSRASAQALLADPEVRRWVAETEPVSVWTPQGETDLVSDLLTLGPGDDWDWMWTATPPPSVEGLTRVAEIGPDAKDELVAFLDEHNPRTHGQPFARPDQLWVGIREPGGRLVACGCSEPGWTPTPFLAGITVAPEHRGQGLGAAVTAYLTREGVARTGACALGLYADNDAARQLYHRLGYVTGARWSSREVLSRTPFNGLARP